MNVVRKIIDVMERQYDEEYEEYIRQARRAKRRQELRRKRRRQAMIRRAVFFGVLLALIVAVLVFVFVKVKKSKESEQDAAPGVGQEVMSPADTENQGQMEAEPAESANTAIGNGNQESADSETSGPESGADDQNPPEDGADGQGGEDNGSETYTYEATDSTLQLGSEFVSTNAVFVDADNDRILAQKDAMTRNNPASMTKVLTLLVAVEHIDNLDDSFTITIDITDYSYKNDCSVAGFDVDETVTVRDLLYGTILPSGADAALGLAAYVSGSQEAFMELMNEKLKELGLADTAHFTNCVGIYDENHYCTVYDLAVIMNAAIENETCREVLSAHTYNTSATEQHPEGILLSNWFLRRIEDKDTGGEVVCGKTGFVNQSGNCAVSYGVDQSGRNYICVTAGAYSGWRCIYDHVDLYKRFSEIT